MSGHNLQPDEYEFHQQRAAYWAIEEEDAKTPERKRTCREMRLESLVALGFITLRETMG